MGNDPSDKDMEKMLGEEDGATPKEVSRKIPRR